MVKKDKRGRVLHAKFIANMAKKGDVKNLEGSRNGPKYRPKVQLMRAIEMFHKNNKVDIIELFVKQAKKHPGLMSCLMNKVLPNKNELSIAPDQLNIFAQKVGKVLAKYISDPQKLGEALAEIEQLQTAEETI